MLEKNSTVELKDEQLNEVTAGTNLKDAYLPSERKENEYNYEPKSPKGVFEKKCEPNVLPAMIRHEGRLLEGQKAVCSDPTFKGTKPECQNCSVNK